MGLDDQAEGVIRHFTGLLALIESRCVIIRHKVVKGNVGGVADLLISREAVPVNSRSRRCVGRRVLIDFQVGHTGIRRELLKAALGGKFVKRGMQIVQIVLDKLLDRSVRFRRVVAAERLVKADLPEGLAKAFDIVRLLQAVEIIQHHAELLIAVLRHRIAQRSGLGIVIELGQVGIVAVLIAEKLVVACQEQRLPVEQEADPLRRIEENIVCRLQGDVILVAVPHHVNAVGCEIKNLAVAVTVEGFLLVAQEELGISVFIDARVRDQVDQRRVIGFVKKRVVIIKGDAVPGKVEGDRIAAVPLKGDGVAVIAAAERIVGILADLRIHEIDQLAQIVDLHIGEVVDAVQKVQREGIGQLVLRVGEVGDILALFRGMPRPFRERAGQHAGQQYECEKPCKCLFHILSPFLLFFRPAVCVFYYISKGNNTQGKNTAGRPFPFGRTGRTG